MVFIVCVHISACAKSFTFYFIWCICLFVGFFLLSLTLISPLVYGLFCFHWVLAFFRQLLFYLKWLVFESTDFQSTSASGIAIYVEIFLPDGLLVKHIKVRRFKDSLSFCRTVDLHPGATTKTAKQKRYEAIAKKKKN